MDTPPLPQLSGPVPAPRATKYGYAALLLSIAGWIVFIGSFFVLALIAEKQSTILGLPRSHWQINRATVGSLVYLSSGLFGLAGILVGAKARENAIGKVGLIAGSVHFGFWTLFCLTALFFGSR